MVRRFPLGLPSHLWLMLGEKLPGDGCQRLLNFVKQFDYGDTSKYGLYPPPSGEGGITGYQGRELIDAVIKGLVTPINGVPLQFHEETVDFADGSTHAFDMVIMATGYRPVLHQYLDIEMTYNEAPWQPASACDWMIGPNGQRGWPLRDDSQHPNGRQIAGYPGLYLVGVFYKGKGAMFNMNIEAEIAAEQIQAHLRQIRQLESVSALPDVAVQPAK